MEYLKTQCEKILNNPELVYDIYKEYHDKQELFTLTSSLDIKITPEQVMDIIELWISDKLSSRDIKEWANFIRLSDAYDTEERSDDFFHYDVLWGILAEISTPEIDGPLTVERSNEYIEELSKL